MSCGCQSPHFHLSLSQCLPSIPCFLNLSSFFFLLISTSLHLLVPVGLGKRVASKGNRSLCYFVIQPPTMFWRCQPLCRYSKKKTVLFKALCSRLFFPVLPWVNCITFHTHVKSLPMKTWRIYYIYKAPAAFDNKKSTSWILNFLQSFIFEKKTQQKTPLALTSWYAFNFKRKAACCKQ